MNNLGAHGIPLMLMVDWNDSLKPMKEGGGAESVFVFLYEYCQEQFAGKKNVSVNAEI